MHLTPHHAKYIAYQLTKRSSADNVEKLATTLVDAQVDLNPHQVEAALFAFRSPLSMGAILADEVGLGKTIEAALVISQKWAERKRKILIITPANLRKQWSQELMDKFFLPTTILESKSFNDIVKSGNLNPFDCAEIILCSYQFARAKDTYIKLIPWDLVVIDEAHRLRNVYKSGNKIARAIKEALDNKPKILLTATPLQNSLLELYGLVSIIDDYAFGDLKSFKAQYSKVNGASDESTFDELKERLKPVCKRTLRKDVLAYIDYKNRHAIVEKFSPTEDEQKLYDLVTDYLQRDNLYALPAGQRKLMTLILRRLLASSTYAISGTLEALATKLDGIVKKHIYTNPGEPFLDNFENYDELKDEWQENDDLDEEPTIYTDDDIINIQQEIKALKEFEALAKSIRINSKGEKLMIALENGFSQLAVKASKKAIIFTESTRTQLYLAEILENKGFSGKVVLFNGTNNDKKSRQIYNEWNKKHEGTDRITGSKSADMRAALVEYFRDEATIMIATEAAAEGINLQFCSLVINYDLPWNPQRIEQRIGRCHRYGQKFDVVVVNFLNVANAADVRVYELLEQKFKLFDGVFGASDEVLGSIESGVDFEKRIAKIYHECRTIEQIELAFGELRKELEEGISDQMKQTRKSLLDNFDQEVHEKLRISLKNESELYLSKYQEWLWQITQFYLGNKAEFGQDSYTFKLLQNPFGGLNIHPGPYRIGKSVDDSNVYRTNHPLAERIIAECKTALVETSSIKFTYSGTPKISIIEPLVGKTGWLKIEIISISTFEIEDYMLFSAFTDEGTQIDDEQCKRLFSLSGELLEAEPVVNSVKEKLNETIAVKKEITLGEVANRNGKWFDDEMVKLDSWADDLKVGLERELKDLDAEIKLRKAEAKKILKLEEKIQAQRQIKDLEGKRSDKRKTLYEAQDEVDVRKESLISNIEGKLRQNITNKELFTIKWKIN